MALLWESLATRDARLLRHSMRKRFAIDPGCAWVNYVRSHDDIGWGFDDRDASEIGIDPRGHRDFLNRFYAGRHEASFCRGRAVPGEPAHRRRPHLRHHRLALWARPRHRVRRPAHDRPRHPPHPAHPRCQSSPSAAFRCIYLGDEIGMLNDPSYQEDIEKEGDARWLHRPAFDWAKAEARHDPESVEGRIFQGIATLVRLRLNTTALAGGDTEIIDPGNDHVFGYFRTTEDQSILCLANFSEHPQSVPAPRLRQLGLRKTLVDIVTGTSVIASKEITLEPLQFAVLLRQGG